MCRTKLWYNLGTGLDQGLKNRAATNTREFTVSSEEIKLKCILLKTILLLTKCNEQCKMWLESILSYAEWRFKFSPALSLTSCNTLNEVNFSFYEFPKEM